MKNKSNIDNLIAKTLSSEENNNTSDLQLKISIYRLLKNLCGIPMLSMDHEIHMLNFLKSYSFISKIILFQQLAGQIGTGNIALLKKQTDQFYLIYLCCDIAGRLLIILQTSKTQYPIYNKECSGTVNGNIIGYPLINDPEALDGINFMICLFGKMSILSEYSALVNVKPIMLFKQIRKQLEDDNLVKNMIYFAINEKSDEINSMYQFYNYPTNYWKTYYPQLQKIHLNWSPEKLLNEDNISELTYNNYYKMIYTGRENCIYYSLSILNKINSIIENGEQGSRLGIMSYCCIDKHKENEKGVIDLKLFVEVCKTHFPDVNPIEMFDMIMLCLIYCYKL